MDDDYDVKSALYPISGEGDPQEVLKTAKTKKRKGIKQEKIGVLIGLSRVGYNKDLTQALIYAEYTTVNDTKKMYILTSYQIDTGIMMKTDETKIEYIQ